MVKSCFRGDTLVQTSKGLVAIEDVKVGDMVVTRHEGDDPGVTYVRRVDQVRKRFVSPRDLVVIQTPSQNIWVTYNHPFYDEGKQTWVAADNVTTSSSLQAISGQSVALRGKASALHLMADNGEAKQVVPVYDLSVHEYDRYAIGNEGLLAASCNNTDALLSRDKQMWGAAAHPVFARDLEKETVNKEVGITRVAHETETQ